MINISHKWELNWDYNCDWDKNSAYTQVDWNQTLITKINQISTQIHMKNLRRGGNIIRTNESILKIIKTSDYYDEPSMMLNNRYKVEIDNLMGNEIYVYSDLIFESVYMIPDKVEYGEPVEEGDEIIREVISDIVFRLSTSLGEDAINEYKDGLIGRIKILNYEN